MRQDLLCTRIFNCLSDVLNDEKYFHANMDDETKALKEKIEKTVKLSLVGKELETDDEAFVNDNEVQDKKLSEVTMKLIPAYDEVYLLLFEHFPDISKSRLPNIAVLADY